MKMLNTNGQSKTFDSCEEILKLNENFLEKNYVRLTKKKKIRSKVFKIAYLIQKTDSLFCSYYKYFVK